MRVSKVSIQHYIRPKKSQLMDLCTCILCITLHTWLTCTCVEFFGTGTQVSPQDLCMYRYADDMIPVLASTLIETIHIHVDLVQLQNRCAHFQGDWLFTTAHATVDQIDVDFQKSFQTYRMPTQMLSLLVLTFSTPHRLSTCMSMW